MILPSNSGSSVTQKNNICQKKGSLTSHLEQQCFCLCKKIHTFSLKRYLKFHVRNFLYLFSYTEKSPEKHPKKKEVCFHWKKFLVKYKNKHWLWISIPIERMMLCITDIHIMIIIFSRKVSSKVSRKTPRVLEEHKNCISFVDKI